MFCVKCGKQINEESTFCTYCGNKVENAPQSQPAQQGFVPGSYGYIPQPVKKSKTGLIVGLCVGGAVLIAAVVLLILLLPGGNSDIAGTWYDVNGYSGTIEFMGNGTFNMQTMGITFSGTYTYDTNAKSGQLLYNEMGDFGYSGFSLDNGFISMNGTMYTKTYVEQMDVSDVLEGLDLENFDLGDFSY